ncbi:hypothetical protein [Deinococcus pimensis]|uniref:hypothetical protein n=1 Tax=Deinococcus pimensis TaxID=309888 RepID=UPI00048866FC|nr:hypothetical protein [Deinococcus pimensis]
MSTNRPLSFLRLLPLALASVAGAQEVLYTPGLPLSIAPIVVHDATSANGQTTTNDEVQAFRSILLARASAGGKADLGDCVGNMVERVWLDGEGAAFTRFRKDMEFQGYKYKEATFQKDATTGRERALFTLTNDPMNLAGMWSLDADAKRGLVVLCVVK